MLEYEWLFFDLGSTLIDESKVYERHMRTVADEANVTYEFVYNKALNLVTTYMVNNTPVNMIQGFAFDMCDEVKVICKA